MIIFRIEIKPSMALAPSLFAVMPIQAGDAPNRQSEPRREPDKKTYNSRQRCCHGFALPGNAPRIGGRVFVSLPIFSKLFECIPAALRPASRLNSDPGR